MIAPAHARQLRRLPGRQEARRHRAERDPRLPRQARLLRLGGAARRRSDAELAEMQRASSTCTSWRSRTRTTATSGRRSRSTATRCSSCCTLVEVAGEELHVGEVNVFVGPNYVLSVRNRTEQGFLGRARALRARAGAAAHGSGYVLYALMDAVVDRYFPVLDALETELEAIEERIFANTSPRANIEALYDVKQKLMTLKHATGAAAGRGGQALRRARAAGLPGPGRVLPRRLRPPGAPEPVASTPCATW